MASPVAVEAILLLAVAFLVPLRLLSLALRLHHSGSSSAAATPRRARSAAALLTIAALLSAIYAVSDTSSHPAAALQSEIDELKLKIARLESILEENTKTLNSKAGTLEEDNKLIEAMEHDIQFLMNEQEDIKKSQSNLYPEGNIKAMEDEVQLLKEEVRKINNNVYTIESLTNDAEKRVEALSSEVKKIENIVAEQWIQVQQFEQAFIVTKMMTSKVRKRSSSSVTSYTWPGKEIFAKYVRDIDLCGFFLVGSSFTRSFLSHAYKECRKVMPTMKGCYHQVFQFGKVLRHHYVPDVDLPNVFFLGGSVSRSCISLAYNQFKISMSTAQKFHHKVQVFLKDAMRSNKYSEGLANELVTFCLAYIVVISPMWIAWFLYSMSFGSKK